LLVTFPFLAITLLWTGLSFLIDPPPAGSDVSKSKARLGMVTTGMYLFECFYSPGMGPVPFSYSAEAFPMQVRDVGMSWATATTWCFNFILSFTWPRLVRAFKPEGAFGWYAAWCVVLWFLVLLFLPETKVSFPPSFLLPISFRKTKLIYLKRLSLLRNWIKCSRCRHGNMLAIKSRPLYGTSRSGSSSREIRNHCRHSMLVQRSSQRISRPLT
jgi:hypothetical protein